MKTQLGKRSSASRPHLLLAIFLPIALAGCTTTESLIATPTATSYDNPLSAEALAGVEAETVKIIWRASFSEWTSNVPPGTSLKIIEATNTKNEIERRLVADVGQRSVYIGPLIYHIQDVPIQLIMFDEAGDRFIIGYIDETAKGTLEFFGIQRFEPIKARWSEGLKQSTIHDRVFFIPIFSSQDDYSKWINVEWMYIQTDESLTRGVQTGASGKEWDKEFDPPIDISDLFIDINDLGNL